MGEIQDVMHMHPVLQAFGVLDPRNLPEEIEELHEYGHSDIDRLADHDGSTLEDVLNGHKETGIPCIDGKKVRFEFHSFKHQLFALKKSNAKYNNTRSVLCLQFEGEPELKAIYPNLYYLYLLSQVITVSTASVERCLSNLSLIKTSLRTRLSNRALDSLLRCNLHGVSSFPDLEWEKIIDQFKDFGPERKINL